VLLFVLALLSKSMAVTLPVLFLILDLGAGRRDYRRIAVEKLPLLALSGGAVAISLWAGWGQVTKPALDLSIPARVIAGMGSIPFYVGKAILPVGLSFYYEIGLVSVTAGQIALTALLAAAIALAWWKAPEARRDLAMGLAFFLVTLLPVLKLVPFGGDAAFADRYMYLPGLGLFLVMARLAIAALRPLDRRAALVLLALPLAGYSAATWRRLEIWRESETLWADVLARHPGTTKALIGLGDHYNETGAHDRAIDLYLQAMGENPPSTLLNNLGRAHRLRGEFDLAVPFFERALALHPGYADAHLNLALTYDALGRYEEALRHLEAIGRAGLQDLGSGHRPGMVLARQGRLEEARRDLEATVALYPDDLESHRELAIVFHQIGRLSEAEAMFMDLARRAPSGQAHYNLGQFHLQTGRIEEARRDFERALAIEPGLEEARRALEALPSPAGD
jgi:tetratricopeptide (TPR) repeat protein